MSKRTLTVKITVDVDCEDGVDLNPHNLVSCTATVSVDPDLLGVLKWNTIGTHLLDKALEQAGKDPYFFPY